MRNTSSSSSSSSSSSMSTDNNHKNTCIFPNEIIAEILTRLPAKSIHRSKCVSKTWNSITSTPHFISSYIARSSPSWIFVERAIKLTSESLTRFHLLHRPNISSLSANPYSFTHDPITDPTYTNCPAVILGSSNGLLLCGFLRNEPYDFDSNPYFFQYIEQNALMVGNPVTNYWVPLPVISPHIICRRPAVGFSSRVDQHGVVTCFLVVEYQPLMGSDYAKLLCFSSKTRKWKAIDGNYMLENQVWRGEGVLEFADRFFWFDLSCGLIVWDQDPFDCVENNDKAVFRFISLPVGCAIPYGVGLEDERLISASSGWIQYVEVLDESDYLFKVWRLKDYDECSEGWSFVYNVSRVDFMSYLPKRLKSPWLKACFIHPFEGDTAYIAIGEKTITFNFRTRKVRTIGSFVGCKYVMPFVLPSWPTSLPPEFCAARAKEKGNEFYKDKKFIEAVRSYTRSIALSPNAFAYANRALAYLKLNMFREAEVDCTEALNFDSKYVKVYGRRAMARKELGNLKGSLEDLEYALQLEPKNKEMKKEYTEIKSMFETV